MKKFIIITDSCSDLPIEYINENKIPFVSLILSYDGKEYKDDFGQSLDYRTFYEDLKNGALPSTSQPNADSFSKVFKKYLEEYEEILYIGVSSGLSGTTNSANIAKQNIYEELKQDRIYIVDSLTASLGLGLLVKKSIDMQKQGKSLSEIKEYIEEEKFKLNTYLTVDDLKFLKNGGRISSTAAYIGIVLHIKPLLTLNKEGKILACLKVKGRKKTINKLVEIVKEKIINSEEQTIAICHGESLKDALKLKEALLKEVNVREVLINEIGPVVGTHGGPGALGVFFFGKERQCHRIEHE
ncbi:MAG: DegV family protein [Clostridiaceae bacterium]